MNRPQNRLSIDAHTGLLLPALQVPSPNFDDRPEGSAAELIVVHCISLPPGRYGKDHIVAFFRNELDSNVDPYFATIAHLQVSAHLLIARDGSISQFVSFNKRAWHAGESSYCGRSRCNDFSIGVELEGTDDSPFEAAQYVSLRRAISALRATYPTLKDAPVVGHSDIAPGRKTDPGREFDWGQLDASSS